MTFSCDPPLHQGFAEPAGIASRARRSQQGPESRAAALFQPGEDGEGAGQVRTNKPPGIF